jgi:hypothetical protein
VSDGKCDSRASLIYQLYRDEHRQLVAARANSEQSLDRSMLTLSSGALAFSLALMQQLFDPARHVWLLAGSWCLFSASIALILVSFLISKKSYDRALEILDDKYETDRWGNEYCNNWSAATSFLNIASISLFLLALFLILCFGIMNIV